MIAVLTCVNAFGVQQGKTRQSKPGPMDVASWENSESFLKLIVPAAVDAVNALRRFNDPIFSSKEGVAVQPKEEDTIALSIFYKSETSYPENERETFHHSHCQLEQARKNSHAVGKFAIILQPRRPARFGYP